MEKIIKIGNKEVRLNNNIGWTMEYRDQFGKDILPVVMPFITAVIESVSTVLAEALTGRSLDVVLPLYQAEFVDLVINVCWAMAKTADETIEPPKKWVRQFDEFYLDEIIPALFDMIVTGFMSVKNRQRLEGIKKTLRPKSHSTTLSSPDSNEG